MQHNSPSKKECTFRNDIYQLYPATSTHHSVPTATIYSSLVQQYAVPPKLSVWLGFKVKATKCMYPVRNCPQSARRRYLQVRVGNQGIFEATLFADIGLSKCKRKCILGKIDWLVHFLRSTNISTYKVASKSQTSLISLSKFYIQLVFFIYSHPVCIERDARKKRSKSTPCSSPP